MSDSKGTLKALSQPRKYLPWTVGLKLLSTAGSLQQLCYRDCRHPAESRGFDRSECKAPAQAINSGQLSLAEHDLSWHQYMEIEGGWSQTRVSNFTSPCMRFEDHGSFWVLWFQVLMLEIFIDERNNFPKNLSPSLQWKKTCKSQSINILKIWLHRGLAYVSSMTKIIHSGERQNENKNHVLKQNLFPQSFLSHLSLHTYIKFRGYRCSRSPSLPVSSVLSFRM